jgi:hypothetical protein
MNKLNNLETSAFTMSAIGADKIAIYDPLSVLQVAF